MIIECEFTCYWRHKYMQEVIYNNCCWHVLVGHRGALVRALDS